MEEVGRLLASIFFIVSSSTVSPGVSPSRTQPMAGPWLSPNIVIVTFDPKVFFMFYLVFS
jgi:hypothetical protein